MMPLWTHFVCALMLTCGFSIIFNATLKKFPVCILVGTISWMSYQLFINIGISSVFSIFLSSCLVWIFSNLFARVFKETATMFIIPGIVSLVPGSGLYYTMLTMIGYREGELADIATETILISCAIAAGLLAMGSVTSVISLLIKKCKSGRL